LPSEENKEGKFPIKEWEKAKKERKFPIKRGGESKKERKVPIKHWKKKKYAEKSLDQTIFELSPSKQEKKGNHDLKWSSPFDCQPKSCASMTCSPHTKQKQKRKRPKTLKAKFPTKKPIPKKKSY